MESNHGKVVVTAALSNKSVPLMKKEFSCKYCNKKFSSYQALGGHHNSHKAEREQKNKTKFLARLLLIIKNHLLIQIMLMLMGMVAKH